MRNIIIVECFSTGTNYVQDIIDRNCNPVILEVKAYESGEETNHYHEDLKVGYESIKADYDLIYEQDTYKETLEMVRKLDPLLIIPGSERGVILATKLANDLNLLCNPIENIDAMTLKNEMQNRLAEKGLRHIKGKMVSTIKEAIDFYESERLKEVVLKPVYSAGSVGVYICKNKDEMIKTFKQAINDMGVYGNQHESILIQERINGTEYVVNTVSHNRIHRITSIWKYHKITTSEGGQVYDTIAMVNEIGLGVSEMIEYAYDVADAIGIKYGPVHGEYMIDEKGPVLIEVNCRPNGCSLEPKFMDSATGQHETDSALDSYLNPKKFHQDRRKGYKPFGSLAMKLFITPKDLIAKSSPMNHISKKLKSYYKANLKPITEDTAFVKTQDLETSGGIIYLSNEDPYQLIKDIEFLRNIEQNAFQLVLSEEMSEENHINEEEVHDMLKSFIEEIQAFGTCLLITDTQYEDLNTSQVNPYELKKINGEFDTVIMNLNESLKSHSDEIVVKFILNAFDKIKDGGLIVIPESTFNAMPSGRIGAEALVRTLNFKIEIPLHQFPKMLIATKR